MGTRHFHFWVTERGRQRTDLLQRLEFVAGRALRTLFQRKQPVKLAQASTRLSTHMRTAPPTALRLESPDAISLALRRRLESYDPQFQRLEFFDDVRELPGMKDIEADLETQLRTQTVRAYHCTRESPHGYFKTQGLRLTDLREHQAEFLTDHGAIFTPAERQTLLDGWDGHFHQNQAILKARNNKVWMCLSRHSVEDGGTAKFFTYFGGEAIYWPFLGSAHEAIAEKLRNIGKPVVVELAVPATDLICFSGLARYVLTCHHRRLNPTAHREQAEAHIKRSVVAREVLEVTPRENFAP